MKTFTFILAATAATLLVAGCGNDSTPQNQTSSTGTNLASTLVNANKNGNSTIDVSYLNSALQLYLTQEGHYPKTLAELKPNYVSVLPILPPGMKLDYDSTNGTVTIVGQ
jgi:hypothetical protein